MWRRTMGFRYRWLFLAPFVDCDCFSSLYPPILVFLISSIPAQQFLLCFLTNHVLHLSVSLPPLSLYNSFSFSSSQPYYIIFLFLFCFHNLYFFCVSDTGGCIHAVCHDSWDQAELDRGFKEVYSAQQLSWHHTVIMSRHVNINIKIKRVFIIR